MTKRKKLRSHPVSSLGGGTTSEATQQLDEHAASLGMKRLPSSEDIVCDRCGNQMGVASVCPHCGEKYELGPSTLSELAAKTFNEHNPTITIANDRTTCPHCSASFTDLTRRELEKARKELEAELEKARKELEAVRQTLDATTKELEAESTTFIPPDEPIRRTPLNVAIIDALGFDEAEEVTGEMVVEEICRLGRELQEATDELNSEEETIADMLKSEMEKLPKPKVLTPIEHEPIELRITYEATDREGGSDEHCFGSVLHVQHVVGDKHKVAEGLQAMARHIGSTVGVSVRGARLVALLKS